jgi:GTP cyclohydrolase I
MDERTPGSQIPEAVRTLLVELGEDPDREGLARTPDRVRRMYAELTEGYHTDPDALLNGAAFDVDYDEMVVVRDIEFFSLCEHHLLPFFGKAHVGYLPRGRIIGLSKIPRVVDMYAHRLQVQERLTQQIAEAIQEHVEPIGVGVVVTATHQCMTIRGAKEDMDAKMTTSALLGVMRDSPDARAEFLALARTNGGHK